MCNGSRGSLDAALDDHEGGQQHGACDERDDRRRGGPRLGLCVGEAVDEREQSRRCGEKAGDVDAAPLGIAVVDQEPQREDRRGHRDHQVDVQAPAPGEELGERPAEDQTDRRPAARDRAENSERLRPVRGAGERDRQQSERRRRQQRAERPLERPGGHEHLEILRQPADRGNDGKADQTGDERPFAPEQITELATQQQQAAERQRVGGDDPLPVGRREMKGPLRRGQRDVHDRGVEHHHQLRGPEEREHGPPVGVGSRPGASDVSGSAIRVASWWSPYAILDPRDRRRHDGGGEALNGTNPERRSPLPTNRT